MSKNRKVFTSFDRFEIDRRGRKIPIWRQQTVFLTKAEVIKARENKENLKIKVD